MRTISSNFSRIPRAACATAALLLPLFLSAQGSALLSVAPPPKIAIKKDGTAETKLAVAVRNGYHVNSNKPEEDYLIPLRLSWENGPVKPVETIFPKPEMRKYEFSDKPVSVFTGDFSITTKFKADANAPAGPGVITGKLRYQACSNDTCYPPRTAEIRQSYDVQ